MSLFERENMSIEEIIEELEGTASLFANMSGARAASVIRAAIEKLKTHPEAQKDRGEVSDGYHTFNELYHHRAVLFSVICNDRPDLAWKSKLHADGSMFDGMFIVGVQTPDGQATYHYDLDPYWDMFDVQVLERAPEWDGHTPAQAIERIANIAAFPDAQPHEPLTLEELREMRGKGRQPLWIRQDDGDGFWALCRVSGDRLSTDYGGWFDLGDYGKTWTAYRRPPEEATE